MDHYELMVENATKIIGSLAKDPEGLSGSFLENGLISQGTFDEVNQLSKTKKDKGRVLYSAIISVVKDFPGKFNDFIRTLEKDKTTHRELLIHLTGNPPKGISIVETNSPGSKGYKDSGTHAMQVSRKTFEGWSRKKVLDFVDNKTILGEDDLGDVLQVLQDVSAEWNEICTKLHVKSNKIRSLASSNNTPYVCLTEGLTEWLQRNYNYQQYGKPTWRKVASCVANTVLFLKIAEKHLKEGVEIYDTQEIEEEEENRPLTPPMKEPIPPPGTPSTPVPAAAGSDDKVYTEKEFESLSRDNVLELVDNDTILKVPDPSSAASGLPSSTNSQTEFQESFSPCDVADWLKRIGLMDRDIKLLQDDGFGTAPGFKMLTVKDLKEMNYSRGGRKLLSQHLVTVAPETVPSCENLSVSAARETIEEVSPVQVTENAPDIETLSTSPSNEALLESVDDTKILVSPVQVTENAPDIETLSTSPSNEALLESVDDTKILDEDVLVDISDLILGPISDLNTK